MGGCLGRKGNCRGLGGKDVEGNGKGLMVVRRSCNWGYGGGGWMVLKLEGHDGVSCRWMTIASSAIS
jgi:hypothetical protein